MIDKDLLESLKIDTSELRDMKPVHVKSVKINIYLDPKEKEKAKANGTQIPVKIDVDKIRQQVLSKNPKSSKKSYYLKVEEHDDETKNKGGKNLKSPVSVATRKNRQNDSRIRNDIVEHQLDYRRNSPEQTASCKRRVAKPLSPINIVSRDSTIISKEQGDETDRSRKDFDEESICAVEKPNETAYAAAKHEREVELSQLMRHGTYISENCGDRVFLLPVIFNENYTKRKVLMNLNEVYNTGDFWTFWVCMF